MLRTTLLAVASYFALVFGAGFMLGAVRVTFVVPRLGERWAELAEMPLMAIVVYLAAKKILRWFPQVCTSARAWAVGGMALSLLVAAELLLTVVIQAQSVGQYIASRDPVSGSVYLLLLVVFAAMPRLRLRSVFGR